MTPKPMLGSLICRTCRLPLTTNEKTYDDRVEIEVYHTFLPEGVEEHMPDPVPEGEVDQISVCDFCREPGPRWTYPCEDFIDPVKETTDWCSVGDWAACGFCKNNIEANDYETLVDRVVFKMKARGVDSAGLHEEIEHLFQMFKEHRKGAVIKEY